jgi:hypothetical protein
VYVRSTHVRTHVRTRVRTRVRTNGTYVRTYYVRTEIQAHRCNGETSGRCQHGRHHSILRFRLDSNVCSADLHHNPRKHSMWACTCTSACIASLRTVSLWSSASAGSTGGHVRVVVLAGHLLAWLGSRQRASSQSRAALLTRPPVSRINGMDEVVLVGVLRRFDRGVGLRCQSRRGTISALR